MDVRQTWTDRDEAGDYVVPNVLSQRDLVFGPDRMDETVPHTRIHESYRNIGAWLMRAIDWPITGRSTTDNEFSRPTVCR